VTIDIDQIIYDLQMSRQRLADAYRKDGYRPQTATDADLLSRTFVRLHLATSTAPARITVEMPDTVNARAHGHRLLLNVAAPVCDKYGLSNKHRSDTCIEVLLP
jgi:hypothetical protein